jgi:hypothetical protein
MKTITLKFAANFQAIKLESIEQIYWAQKLFGPIDWRKPYRDQLKGREVTLPPLNYDNGLYDMAMHLCLIEPCFTPKTARYVSADSAVKLSARLLLLVQFNNVTNYILRTGK